MKGKVWSSHNIDGEEFFNVFNNNENDNDNDNDIDNNNDKEADDMHPAYKMLEQARRGLQTARSQPWSEPVADILQLSGNMGESHDISIHTTVSMSPVQARLLGWPGRRGCRWPGWWVWRSSSAPGSSGGTQPGPGVGAHSDIAYMSACCQTLLTCLQWVPSMLRCGWVWRSAATS